MVVMKFGGTSVGIRGNLEVAVGLIAERARLASHPGDPVVVVSALAGVTNQLVDYCRAPSERRSEDAPEASRATLARRLADRHRDFSEELGLEHAVLDPVLEEWRAEADRHARTRKPILGADRDRVLAFGERLAAELVAAALRNAGVQALAVLAGDAGLVTDDRFGAAHPLPAAEGLLREAFARWPGVPVVTGFLGRTEDGRVTTLGRGGSDYSAAVLGAALGAEEIQIWTDTSGLLSADPRIVPEARPVPQLSFAEASELAYFGARVLHPKTLIPAMERGIPVRVLNTTRPSDPGSRIAPTGGPADSSWRVKSIASKQGITAITIASTRMLLAHGFLARVFESFGRHHVIVDLVTTSEVSISVTVDDTTHLDDVIAELEGIGNVEVREGLAVVAVVGEGAPNHVGLAGHVFTLLGGVGIGVEMISQGASRVNLSFVVREAHADRAVRLLHRGLGLDAEVAPPPEPHLAIG
ncbi:MAG TPA: aspartate kinase [Candidatus Limnocylindria bacterium]|nr:aspartate kinase [Candidatus Limnocylindria bacterium]